MPTTNHQNQLEVWMQGPVAGVPALLQPAAHTLLQIEKDIEELIQDDLTPVLWDKPFGVASIGFHLQHIPGVIDRMLAYSQDKALSPQQFDYLRAEGSPWTGHQTCRELKQAVKEQIDQAIQLFKSIDESTLSQTRYLGRKRIPTTQIGLLFHAAEHAQRHFGQLLVTVKALRNQLENH